MAVKLEEQMVGQYSYGDEPWASQIALDEAEIWRYLAYTRAENDAQLHELMDSVQQELQSTARFKYVYQIYRLAFGADKITGEASSIELRGEAIQEHLKYSSLAAVMAVSLGVALEQKLQYYSKVDLTRGVMLDAAATTLVEALCDELQSRIAHIAQAAGYYITSRFSPGYADLPLSTQAPIVESLRTDRLIGLSVSESSLLIPRKSVTAIIGIGAKPQEDTTLGCQHCQLYATCRYAKSGEVGCARKTKTTISIL